MLMVDLEEMLDGGWFKTTILYIWYILDLKP